MKTNPVPDANPQPLAKSNEASPKCCWMLAGVVSYKLCDQAFDCDKCGFDRVMRHLPLHPSRDLALPGRIAQEVASEFLLFHPRHVWARVETGGRVRTGLDDFGRRLAGRIYCVQLPRAGTVIEAGDPAWTAVYREGKISLAAPISGVVTAVNEQLARQPALVNQDPYGDGWAIVLTPLDVIKDLQDLRCGAETVPWIEAESERLVRELSRAGGESTCMDGGHLVDDIHEAIPSRLRAQILDLFLSANTNRPSRSEKAGATEGR